MNTGEHLLALTQKTIDELESGQTRLSNIIRSSIRLARLRSDYENLWWLEYEMISLDDKESRKKIHTEITPHYTREEFQLKHKSIVESHISEREIEVNNDGKDEKRILLMSIDDIEDKILFFDKEIEKSAPPPGMHTLDLYYAQQGYNSKRLLLGSTIVNHQGVLNRVKHRVHNYLSHVEKQLMYGQINSDIFERNRRYVEQQLSAIAPEALEQFVTAYRRLDEGEAEAGSQALLSCRRILKSVADRVYPARTEPVIGADGRSRKLSEDMYKARLWQFVTERVGGSTSGQLVLAQIEDLGNRIDRVYELASKGVHADVSDAEVSQCIIQTYLLIGDILRLNDQTSAIHEEGVDAA